MKIFVVVFLLALTVQNVFAETPPKMIFNVSGDFNHDGVTDRAALVVRLERDDPKKGFRGGNYLLDHNGQVDLFIYMGAGADVLNISRPPTFEKDNIIDQSRGFIWVTPPTINRAGSLLIHASQNEGAAFANDETLTWGFNGNAPPQLIGYDHSWNLRYSIGSCGVNIASGSAVRDPIDSPQIHYKVAVKPIPLAEWTIPIWNDVCEP